MATKKRAAHGSCALALQASQGIMNYTHTHTHAHAHARQDTERQFGSCCAMAHATSRSVYRTCCIGQVCHGVQCHV